MNAANQAPPDCWPSAPEKLAARGSVTNGVDDREKQAVQILGPDGIVLLIEPYSNGYVWKILNEGLRPIGALRFKVIWASSFDAKKLAFRQPEAQTAEWTIDSHRAGDISPKGTILVRIEGDHLELDNTIGFHQLSWPSGDPVAVQGWLLTMKIIGLSQEWPIELDLRWRAGTKTLELSQYSPEKEHSSGGHTNASVETPNATQPDTRDPAQDPGAPAPESSGKKPVRRNPKYKAIDSALKEISQARPKNHEEVFRFLDERKVALPRRKLFKDGWLKGFSRTAQRRVRGFRRRGGDWSSRHSPVVLKSSFRNYFLIPSSNRASCFD